MLDDATQRIGEIIREDDYCNNRTLAELESYIEAIQGKIHSDDELRKAVRRRASRSKEFFQELRPILLFMKYLAGEGEPVESITPALGSQNYDALLYFREGERSWFRKLEVTEAIDGHEDSIRMDHLNRYGRVSITAPMKQTGTKKSGRTVQFDNIAVLVSETAEKLISLVDSALTKKAGKSYERGTWLVVVFDDHLFLKEDRKEYLGSLETIALVYAESTNSTFERVTIIGQTGAVFGDAFCPKADNCEEITP